LNAVPSAPPADTQAMQGLRFVDADGLQALRAAPGPFIVAFVATWNRRCQAFAAEYRGFAQRWQGVLPVVCVDVDECRAPVVEFVVCSVPTLMLFDGGRLVHREAAVSLAGIDAALTARGHRTP
jgi:thiol-disulfide isomerase/thioredoxin